MKLRTSKEYQQHQRTREQGINDKYILKQQMEYQVSMLSHDGDCSIYEKDDDDNNKKKNKNKHKNKNKNESENENENNVTPSPKTNSL